MYVKACKIDPKLVLDVDGHISAMQVIASQDEASDDVKVDCMQLLGALCCSRQGKQAISGSSESIQTIEFASDCIVYHSKSFTDTLLTGECDLLDNLVDKSESDVNSTYSVNDNNLALASITFLSSIAREKDSRLRILQDGKLKEAFSKIFEKSSSPMIRFAIASLLASLARYAKDFSSEESCYSIETMFSMIALVFSPNQAKQNMRVSASEKQISLFGNFSKTHQYNDNLVQATAYQAFEHMLSDTPENLTRELISNLAQKLSEVVSYEMKTSKKIAMKTRNSGLFACNITSIFSVCASRIEFKADLTSDGILIDLLRIILLNPAESVVEGKKDGEDEKNAQSEERRYWNCCVTNCLQCISSLSIDPEIRDNNESSWDEIMALVESEVQFYIKGKRKIRLTAAAANDIDQQSDQITIVSALTKFVNGGLNASSAVAAGKIMDNLDM